MKINKDLMLKVLGLGLTLAGTVVSGIASDRETKKTIEKLVNEQLKKQEGPTGLFYFFLKKGDISNEERWFNESWKEYSILSF